METSMEHGTVATPTTHRNCVWREVPSVEEASQLFGFSVVCLLSSLCKCHGGCVLASSGPSKGAACTSRAKYTHSLPYCVCFIEGTPRTVQYTTQVLAQGSLPTELLGLCSGLGAFVMRVHYMLLCGLPAMVYLSPEPGARNPTRA